MDIENCTVFPQSYEMMKKDRENRGGGGVALCVRKDLRSIKVDAHLRSEFQEFLVASVMADKVEILVTVVYNLPKNNGKMTEYDIGTNNEGTVGLVKKVADIAVTRKCKLLIMGDFNYKEINWQELNPHGDHNSWRARFLDCVQKIFLYQQVLESSAARGSDTPSVLDLVFTQSDLEITNMNYLGRMTTVS